jgi:hypothetical protein
MFQLNGMASTTTENMAKKYGKQVAYLFDEKTVKCQTVGLLASGLKEDLATIEKIIEREVSMHFLRRAEKENDPNLIMISSGNIWNSLYGNIGKYEMVCERSCDQIVLMSAIKPMKFHLHKQICAGLYLENPDESVFFCNKYSKRANEYGFFDISSLDILYDGPEHIGKQPRDLCRDALQHVNKDSTKALSIGEIADMLSRRLSTGIPDYDAKAQVVRSKLL